MAASMKQFDLKPLSVAMMDRITKLVSPMGRSMVRGVVEEWDLLTCLTALALVASIHNSRTKVKLTAMSLMQRTRNEQLRQTLAMFTQSRDPIMLIWLTIEEMGL